MRPHLERLEARHAAAEEQLKRSAEEVSEGREAAYKAQLGTLEAELGTMQAAAKHSFLDLGLYRRRGEIEAEIEAKQAAHAQQAAAAEAEARRRLSLRPARACPNWSKRCRPSMPRQASCYIACSQMTKMKGCRLPRLANTLSQARLPRSESGSNRVRSISSIGLLSLPAALRRQTLVRRLE